MTSSILECWKKAKDTKDSKNYRPNSLLSGARLLGKTMEFNEKCCTKIEASTVRYGKENDCVTVRDSKNAEWTIQQMRVNDILAAIKKKWSGHAVRDDLWSIRVTERFQEKERESGGSRESGEWMTLGSLQE